MRFISTAREIVTDIAVQALLLKGGRGLCDFGLVFEWGVFLIFW